LPDLHVEINGSSSSSSSRDGFVKQGCLQAAVATAHTVSTYDTQPLQTLCGALFLKHTACIHHSCCTERSHKQCTCTTSGTQAPSLMFSPAGLSIVYIGLCSSALQQIGVVADLPQHINACKGLTAPTQDVCHIAAVDVRPAGQQQSSTMCANSACQYCTAPHLTAQTCVSTSLTQLVAYTTQLSTAVVLWSRQL
jgi:hypothetical protein